MHFDDVRPRRLLEWHEEQGCCVLLRPRLGASRLGRWLAGVVGAPPYHINLDDVGTVVWKACDGRSSLADIAAVMRRQFGDRVEPAEDRLARFVRTMIRGRMIALSGVESPLHRSPDTGL